MKITDFPLGEVPFLAIDRLTESMFDSFFIPTDDWKQDLKEGTPTPLVYHYPKYIDFLYEVAICGENFENFLSSFHSYNPYWFKTIFKEVEEKLVKLSANSVRLNHLNETVLKNGKLKL